MNSSKQVLTESWLLRLANLVGIKAESTGPKGDASKSNYRLDFAQKRFLSSRQMCSNILYLSHPPVWQPLPRELGLNR